MTIQELLEYMDGAGLIIVDYNEIEKVLRWFESTLKSKVQLDGQEL